MSCVLVTVLLLAGPVAVAFDADLAPFLEKRSGPADPETMVPEIKPVDPNAPFPKLPPVEAMLNTSAHTVSEIVQEVTKIQARVHNVEQQDQSKLALKKSEFEAQLKSQDQDIRDVIAENAGIVSRITALQKGNEALREASKNLQAENEAMRAELRSAATKVTAAGEFIKTSEKSTDDRHAKVLAVLSEGVKHQRRQPVTPVHTDSDDDDEDTTENEVDSNDVVATPPSTEEQPKGLVHIFGHHSKATGKTARVAKDGQSKKEDDDDDDEEDADNDKQDDKDDAAESFMQMDTEEGESEEVEESDSEEAHAESADNSVAPFDHHHGLHHKNKSPSAVAVDGASRSMLQAVSQELKDLAAEDEQGLERQTQLFHAQLAQEHHAYKAALAQQRALNKTEASLLTLQSKLHRAVAHLQGTKSHLQQRVRGVGQYLQHLAHLLLAPDKEAAGLVDSMPQDVPIPAAVSEPAPAATPPASTLSAGAALLQHLSAQIKK